VSRWPTSSASRGSGSSTWKWRRTPDPASGHRAAGGSGAGIVAGHAGQVLDLGTGSGAIALALASERPAWQVTAVDRVLEAVALAERNRQRLNLNNATVLSSHWFSACKVSA
jgi:tRNA G46 methylase TrmB